MTLRRRNAILVTGLALGLIHSFADARQSDPLNEKALGSFLDPLFASKMVDEHVPGAVISVVWKNEIVFAKGYGVADVTHETPVDPATTIFRIGSTTKALTALGVFNAVDRGTIDLDTDINTYLDHFKVEQRYDAPVRVKHLLSHTGGFDQIGVNRTFLDPARRPSLADWLKRDLRTIRSPGRDSCYDTYGLSLAGHLLEAVSGLDYATYMRQHVFAPLGMNRTAVEAPVAWRDDLAMGYSFDGSDYVQQPYEYYTSLPASSIDATAIDMGNLLIALLGDGTNHHGRLFSAGMTQRLHRPQYRAHPDFPGFAWGFWEELTNGQRVISHGGVMWGFNSLLYMIPEQELGLFIAINRDPETGPHTQMVGDIKDRLMDAWFPPVEPEPDPVMPEPLPIDTKRFEGTYIGNLYCHTCPEGEGWMPNRSGSRLTSVGPGVIKSPNREYYAVEPLLFVDATGRLKLAFSEDDQGRIAAVALNVRSPGLTEEKVGERLIEEVAGAAWRDGPMPPIAAIVYRLTEQWADAARAYDEIAGSAEPESIGLAMARYQGGYCHLENGDGAAAAERLAASRVFFEHLMEQSGPLGRLGRQYFRQSHFNQIAAHAVAGQNDEAFALIHEAINKYGVPPAAMAEDLLESPKMKNLLDDPRFQALKN